RFPWEPNLRRGAPHRQLVAGNSVWASQLVTHKIHFWEAFLFVGGSNSLFISCSGKPAEMALRCATLLYRVLHLDLGLCGIGFWPILVPLAEEKIQLTNYPHNSSI